jgi:hypothetical protein
MRYPLAIAVAPLAAVLLLPRLDVVLVQVLNEIVHVVEVSGVAAVPLADRDLVLAVVVVCRHARVVRRGGDGAICVFRNLSQVVGRRQVHRGWV